MNTDTPHKANDDKPRSKPEDTAVYIGTNVEYAEMIETNASITHKTGKAHFLRDACAQHGDEYKKLMIEALQS